MARPLTLAIARVVSDVSSPSAVAAALHVRRLSSTSAVFERSLEADSAEVPQDQEAFLEELTDITELNDLFKYIRVLFEDRPHLLTLDVLIPVIYKCGIMQQEKLAFHVYQKCLQSPMDAETSKHVHTAMLEAYGLSNNVPLAHDLFLDLIRSNVQVDEEVFKMVMSMCYHAHMVEEAEMLFDTLHEKGLGLSALDPDEFLAGYTWQPLDLLAQEGVEFYSDDYTTGSDDGDEVDEVLSRKTVFEQDAESGEADIDGKK